MKRKLRNWYLRKLFSGVTEDDVLQIIDGEKGKAFKIGTDILPEKDTMEIIKEAQMLNELPLWGLLMNDIRWTANKAIYFKSQNEADIMYGKALLYAAQIIQTRVRELSGISRS